MYGNNQSVSNINAFGFAQKMGESSVLALSIMSMGFGEIDITTENIPENVETYTSLTNIVFHTLKSSQTVFMEV